jgi:hypothetical protein
MVETDHRHTWLAYIHRVTSVLGAHTSLVKNLVDRELGALKNCFKYACTNLSDPQQTRHAHKPSKSHSLCFSGARSPYALAIRPPIISIAAPNANRWLAIGETQA